MRAVLLTRDRIALGPDSFVASVLWHVPQPVLGSSHQYKYGLAYVVRGVCVVRYDNERGKGDHRHIGHVESSYTFTTIEQLIADFWSDVKGWREQA
jgi:hypothetical protein